MFIPIKHIHDSISGTESDDSSIRSVRFSKLAEVREMSAYQATEALLSRLSYNASLRIRRQKSQQKTARSALLFCVLWLISKYTFEMVLNSSETILNIFLNTTSSFFTMALSGLYPSSFADKFTCSKFICVLMSSVGTVSPFFS